MSVTKLHGGFSGSLVLNVDVKIDGRAGEPTVLKLDSAECTIAESQRTNRISELVGAEAIRALRGPMYVGPDGEDKTMLDEDELDPDGDLGGVVLEMAGACWVMPEFYGKLGKVQLLDIQAADCRTAHLRSELSKDEYPSLATRAVGPWRAAVQLGDEDRLSL